MLIRPRILAPLLIAAISLATAQVAAADGGGSGGGTSCTQNSGSCTVTITVPGSGPSDGSSPGGSGSEPVSNPDSGASPSASSSSAAASPPCSYAPDPTYKPPAGSDPHPAGSGAWYFKTCLDLLGPLSPTNIPIAIMTIVWLANPPGAAAIAPTPAQLAAQAESILRLGTPQIATSPRQGEKTFPGVNVWAWIASGSWAARSATASAAGESVTATASPSYATWDFGDGSTVTCQGPGTVYQASDGPNPVSPTCGHAYSQPGSYTASVTVHWSVSWSGAGQTGAFNDLTTSASAPVTVGESEAVVTR